MTTTIPGHPPASVAASDRTSAAWRRWVVGLVRGNSSDPRWVRPTLLALLGATAILYCWGLGASGYANSFYSAAAQAGADSWSAFFFGSSDAANSITVDKTPASLWLMALSVRMFGLSSWSILLPQALAGVATVGVLYATIRRWFSPSAALIAGAVMALTPVATLMFRFNNPDALLVLLLTLGAYATVRAVEKASTKWLMLVGVLVGFAFLTKMLQALLVIPAFALVYLIAAPTGLGRRIRQLLLAGVALVVAGGWWVAIVELIPAQYRPYIGGSQTNSVLDLMFGYNGLGRLNGEEVGSVGGGGGGGGGRGWGETGIGRLFNAENGGQVAWLLPAALVLVIAALVLRGRAPRTDRARAAFVLWGGWLVVTALVFSFMAGIYHAYYTVALAPSIGAVVGMGAVGLWRLRGRVWVPIVLALTLAGTAVWAYVLLGRSTTFVPWLRTVILVVGIFAALALLVVELLPRRAAQGVAAVAAVVALAGPMAYSLQTAASAHTGSIPTAGPAVANARGGGPGGGGGRMFGQGQGQAPQGAPPGGGAGGFGGGGGGGGAGGLLNGANVSAELVALLKAGGTSYTWAAASVGSQNAASYQLASGLPVMAIGGFNGSDPSPTLAQFQQYVAEGKIHYFLGGGGFGSRGGSSSSTDIAEWVAANFEAQTVGNATVYDLTSGSTASASV